VRNLAEGVVGTVWYQFEGPGWRYGGLLDGGQSPKPAYDALKFITVELDSADYIGRVDQSVNIVGYKFRSDLKTIWVLWSPNGNSYPVTLPGNFKRVLEKDGSERIIINNQTEVSSPIYVEFNN
jgi:hypothetical protein